MTVPFISKFLENLTIIPVLKFWLKLRSFVFFMIHAKIVIWSYFLPTSITIKPFTNIQISFEPCSHQVKDEHFRAYIIEYCFMLFIKKFINICTFYWITVHPGICDGVRIFWLATRTINKFMLNVFGELHTQFKTILARLSIEYVKCYVTNFILNYFINNVISLIISCAIIFVIHVYPNFILNQHLSD